MPVIFNPINLTPEQRQVFWSFVDKRPDTCWPWLGYANTKGGYGRFKVVGGRGIKAHRIAYALAKGNDPGQNCVCHTCDNPLCCNPSHLFLGSYKDNLQDAKRKKRNAHGEKHGRAKLTEEQVTRVIAEVKSGRSYASVGRQFAVHPTSIRRICTGERWSHRSGS